MGNRGCFNNSKLYAFLLLLLLLLLVPTSHAQVLREKQQDAAISAIGGLPDALETAAELESLASDSGNSLPDGQLAARAGEAIILSALEGIVIHYSETAEFAELDSTAVRGVRLVDAPHFDASAFQSLLAEAFIDKPLSMESLQRLRGAVSQQVARSSSPFAIVSIPPQELADGVLRVHVQAAMLDKKILIRGNQYFSSSYIESRLQGNVGKAVNISNIDRDSQRLNRNPYLNASLKYRPGSESASTGLVVDVRDRRPSRFYLGANNTGNALSQEERRYAGLHFGNAFGLGHQFGLRYTAAYDSETSRSLSANYSFELPWLHSLTFFGARSNTAAELGPPLDQSGSSKQLGFNYDIDLQTNKPGFRHSLQWGVDLKDNDNSLQFQFFSQNLELSNSETRVLQARIRYQANWYQSGSVTRLGWKLTAAPGDLSARNDNEAFAESRAFAEADYFYTNFDLSHSRALTGLLQDWTWKSRMELQYSDTNLIGSEQFAAGGTYSVRGYEEGEISGDNALLLSSELQSGRLFSAWFGNATDLRLRLFTEYAITESVDRLTDEDSASLLAAGYGLDLRVADHLTVYLSHGFQLKDSRSSNTGDNHRFHLGMELSY